MDAEDLQQNLAPVTSVTLEAENQSPPPSTTLVTGFFDISQETDANKNSRPLDFYLTNARPTLSQPYPMVIFCSPTLLDSIKAIRDELCPDANEKTIYFPKCIKTYEYWRTCRPVIEENRKGDALYANHRNTVSYCLVTNFKVYMMKLAHDLDHFKTTHFAWIDFGGGHACKDMSEHLPEIMKNPEPSISMLYIHYRSKAELYPIKRYVRGGPCGLAGNFWTVEKSYIPKLFLCFYSAYYKLLVEGVGHGDEQTFQYVYDEHPEWFRLYYGDYGSVYSNYFLLRKDYHGVRWHFIHQAIQKGDKVAAKHAIRYVMEADDYGLVKTTQQDRDAFSEAYR
jgi:hypothetical protein